VHSARRSPEDEVFLDIERREITDAHPSCDQQLDRSGGLGLDGALADIVTAVGGAHQLAWQTEQRRQTVRLCRQSSKLLGS
jgi:hypothetical protein